MRGKKKQNKRTRETKGGDISDPPRLCILPQLDGDGGTDMDLHQAHAVNAEMMRTQPKEDKKKIWGRTETPTRGGVR